MKPIEIVVRFMKPIEIVVRFRGLQVPYFTCPIYKTS
jgi:hypothetical protein